MREGNANHLRGGTSYQMHIIDNDWIKIIYNEQ